MQKLGSNPWGTVWTAPRKTIRAIVEADPRIGFFLLSSISVMNIFFYVNSFFPFALSYKLAVSIIIALILSPVIGSIWIYLFSLVLYLSGKLVASKVLWSQIKSAGAWSQIPYTLSLFMWAIFLTFSPTQIYSQYEPNMAIGFVNTIVVITWLWSTYLLMEMLSELGQLSRLHSLIQIAVSYLFWVAVILIIYLPIFFTT